MDNSMTPRRWAQLSMLMRLHLGRGENIAAAEECASLASSAVIRGDQREAAELALTSIGYSVGSKHPDYALAIDLITEAYPQRPAPPLALAA